MLKNPKFQLIRESEDSSYYFQLRAVNGKVVLKSNPYGSRQECMSAISEVKDFSIQPEKDEKQGKYSVEFKNRQGRLIGKSRNYKTMQARDKVLSVIQRDAALAGIEDYTKEQ